MMSVRVNKMRPVAVVRARRPDLLTVDDPLVAVAHRHRAQPAEVGAGAGLGEQLAPHLFAPQHRAQVALLLLVGAVRDQHRARHADADGEDARRGDHLGFFLFEDAVLDRRAAAPAVGLGPRDAGPPVIELDALPVAATLHVRLLLVVIGDEDRVLVSLVRPQRGHVLVQKRLHLGAERCFVGSLVEVHGQQATTRSSNRANGASKVCAIWARP